MTMVERSKGEEGDDDGRAEATQPQQVGDHARGLKSGLVSQVERR